MTIIHHATVKFKAGPPRATKFGERINVLFTLPDGREEKLWGNPGDPIQNLQNGQEITVVQTNKGFELVDDGTLGKITGQAPAQAPQGRGFEMPDNDTKHAMADYIDFSSRMQRHCYDKAHQMFRDESDNLLISEREVMAAANTLFIQAMRRFNL